MAVNMYLIHIYKEASMYQKNQMNIVQQSRPQHGAPFRTICWHLVEGVQTSIVLLLIYLLVNVLLYIYYIFLNILTLYQIWLLCSTFFNIFFTSTKFLIFLAASLSSRFVISSINPFLFFLQIWEFSTLLRIFVKP